MLEIEEQSSLVDIVLLGEKLISFYLGNIMVNENMTQNSIVNDALNYIHNNLSEDLTLDKVSNAIHISKNYLSCLFPKYVGHSFSYYLRMAKIDRSKELLVDTNLSLLEIALECGFNSQSYFCNVFKEFEGITPKQYRHYHHMNNRKKPLY